MSIRIHPLACLVAATIVLSAVSASGQGRDQGRDRRREGYDPAELLKRMDENNNGKIEPNEISSRSRSFVERAAERAKLDPRDPLPLDRLLPAMQAISEEYRKEREGNSDGSSSSSSSPSGKSSPGSRPTFAPPAPRLAGGFGGPPAGGAPVASSGFGSPSGRAGSIISLEAKYDQVVIDYVNGDLLRRLDKNGDGSLDSIEWKANTWSKPPEDSDLNKDGKLSREELCIRISKSRGIPVKGEAATTTSSVSSSPSGGSSGGSSEQYRKYAEGLLKTFDKSKDGMLQRDEWKEMKAEHQGADSNGDGTITQEELTARITSYSSGSGSYAASAGTSNPGGSLSYGKKPRGGADKTASTEKKSYRFLTPTERLPKGMPDWFVKNDADGDGQIMMAEYAASFTESIAAEFAKYDLDGDGIITPNECLAVDKKK
jgi:Ca2+-binding EF-hand superfamily protein